MPDYLNHERDAARRRADDLARWQRDAEATACDRTHRPWDAVLIDGSRLHMLATSRAHAISSARELCLGRVVRVERGGDW